MPSEERKQYMKAYNKEYRLNNLEKLKANRIKTYYEDPEKEKQSAREWRAANRQRVKEYNAAWRAANPEKMKAAKERWNKANPDKVCTNRAVYYQLNKEAEEQKRIEWRLAHPNNVKQHLNNRRARKAEVEGSFTAEQWDTLKALFGNVCLCCGISELDTALSRDHVIPLSKGGSNDISNIQPLCKPCNSKKGTKSTDYRPTTRQPLMKCATLRNGDK